MRLTIVHSRKEFKMERFIVAGLLLISSASVCSAQSLSASRIRNRRVRYVASEKLKQYPVPPIIFERGGLASKLDQKEIIGKIIYPVVNKSDQPVAAVVVEFFPDNPSIAVTVVWHGVDRTGAVNFVGALIDRNKAGHFDADAYKVFFPEMDESSAPHNNRSEADGQAKSSASRRVLRRVSQQ
jgi:hypothetical protein